MEDTIEDNKIFSKHDMVTSIDWLIKNKEYFNKFSQAKVDSTDPENEDYKRKLISEAVLLIIGFFELVCKDTESWDRGTQYYMSQRRKTVFLESLVVLNSTYPDSEFNNDQLQSVARLFISSYEFMREVDCWSDDLATRLMGQDYEYRILAKYKSFSERADVKRVFSGFNWGDIDNRINKADSAVPSGVVRRLLHSDNVKILRDHNSSLKELKKQIVLAQHYSKEAEALKNNLKEAAGDYNFVGLNFAFRDLLKIKRAEKKGYDKAMCFWMKCIFGGITVAVIASLWAHFGIPFLGNFGKSFGVFSPFHLSLLVPILACEAMFMYMFKINYNYQRSVNAQLLQIKLRKAITVFIKEYGEFAKDMKEKDAGSFGKFEELIFSNIVADYDKIPDAMDGLDKIASLIKSVKK